MSPGSLIHVGNIHEGQPRIRATHYSKKSIDSYDAQNLQEIIDKTPDETLTWVDIEGLKNIALITEIGEQFKVHPLVLEDILNTNQRPKIEDYNEYLYIVLKNVSLDKEQVVYEQVSILLFENYVFTFKERRDELFIPIYKRIQKSKSRIRTLGTDYLVYVILDTVVDQKFMLQDALDEIIDATETELLDEPDNKIFAKIQKIKRDLIYMRRSISPLRELLHSIMREDNELIEQQTLVYFKDVYDHVLRISETSEIQRDMVYSLLDMYQTHMSNKMNEVMKVLTIFASIFIPLTFIAGIYGMNFEYMPELKWRYSYPELWMVFIAITVGLIYFFKKKKWL